MPAMGRQLTVQNTLQTYYNIFKLVGRLTANNGRSTIEFNHSTLILLVPVQYKITELITIR